MDNIIYNEDRGKEESNKPQNCNDCYYTSKQEYSKYR